MSVRDRIHRAEHGRTRIWALLLAFGTFASQIILLTPNLALAAVPIVTPDGYSVVQDGSLSVDWWDADWTKRRKIVFDNSLQGTDLDDFPVLVTVPGATFDYGETQNLGQDLRFIDATGTPLSHEIEVWNESGDSYVWVKVPRIDAGSMTDSIWMYYGNTLALGREDASGVWSNGYVGVWHFNEDPAGGAGSIKDSTSYANHGDPYNMDASNSQPGAIGTGLYFPGTTPNPDYVRIASSGADELAITGTQLTLEAWARQTGDTSDWSVIVGRQLGVTSADSYTFATKFDAPNRPVIVAAASVEGPGALPVNTWRYVAGVRDGGDLTLYANGGQVGQLTGLGTSITTDVNDVLIGAGENDATAVPIEPWLGHLDEVRISDVARSADWVRAQNLSMTGALAALQVEEDAPAADGVLGNDNDPEDDPLTAILVSPPSQALGFTFRDDGTFLYTPNPGYSGPDSFDYKVNDGSGDSITVTAAITVVGGISGRVFEDVDGNLLAGAEAIADADNPVVVGATVYVYADDGTTPDAPDAADTQIAGNPFTTGPSGFFTTGSLSDGKYWVVVDSKTVPASQELTESPANIWAEQTYGWIGSLCADGAGGTGGPSPSNGCYGGRRADQSDDLTTWHSGAEHIASVIISGGFAVPNVDFGFSFNAVTNTLAGDARDDDGGAAGRIVQGSLRQFMTNANALSGENSMRFVPAEATNATGDGGNWWRIDATVALPPLNDADTAVDGTAYDLTGAVRNDNPGAVGTGGTVGADDIPLAQVPRSELQIDGSGLVIIDDGGGVVPHRTTVRALSITEAGSQAIRVNNISQVAPVADDIVLEDLIIGMPPFWQPQTLPTGTSAGIHLNATNRALLRDSFIGWTNGRTLNLETSTDAVISGSEFRDTNEDVIDIYEGSSGTLFENNRVSGGLNWAIDITVSSNTTLRNNTIDSAGDGVGQTGGVRLFGPGSTIDRNVFSNNSGPAIAIAGTMTTSPRPVGEAVITQNIFINNDGLSIDLQPASDDNLLSGDGITPNNGGALDPDHGNRELDFPGITGAVLSGGITTVTGTACNGCTVEIYEAVGGTGDDDPPGSGTNYHGEGVAYLGSGVATGGSFSIDVTGLIAGDAVSATATDTGLAVTSEFSLNETVTVLANRSVSGTVFEDTLGDGLADGPIGVGANPFESGVRVELFLDGGDNQPDGVDDVYQGFTVSALADGTYSFTGLAPGIYWVNVDSQGVSGGTLNAGFAHADTWAEQTYGPVGAASFDGSSWSFAGSAGAHYGGARADVSDSFAPAASLPGAEHIARIDLTAGSQSAVDFGFGFNVVTSAEAATAAGVSGRSAQGSLDQFIRNANAVAGANAMRFVPAVTQNDGSGDWWRIDYSAAPNPLQDIFDAGTVIDGTAFAAADGVTVVDSNGGFLGANAAGGVTVGTGSTPLPQVAKPELEIKDEGFRLSQARAPLLPNNAQIRNVSIWGSATSIYATSGVSSLTGLVFDGNVIGTPPNAFVDPASVGANYGLRVYRATGTQVTNNLIGFVDYTPLLLETSTSGATVTGNEIRGGGRTQSAWDGLLLWGTGDTIDGNLIADNGAMGIDLNASVGGHTIENNTVRNSGLLGVQTAGLRIKNHDNTVRFNIFENNAGPGVSVEGGAGAALRNLISGNEFTTNDGLSIDLALLALADNLGDGVNANDSVTDATHGNEGLDYPVITSAQHNGTTATIDGTTCGLCRVEVYRAVGGAGDAGPGGNHGEGVEYLGFTTADAAGVFSFATTLVGPADEVSTIAIDGTNNTSEFGENHPVNGAPVFDADLPNRSDAEGTVVSLASGATDPDLDTLAYSATGLPPGLGINPTSGLISGTIGFGAAAGSPYAVSITVVDGNGGSDNDLFTWTVTNTNRAPTADAIADTSIDELALLSFTATGSDPDLDGLLWTMPSGPAGASITAGGVFSWTPTEAQGPGSYPVTLRVTDDGTPNLWDEESFTANVGEVNLAPTLNAVGDRSVVELVNLSFTATASDPDTPANDLTFSLSGAPAGASITSGGVFSWTPTEAQGPGSYVFDVVVTETNGSPSNLSDSETITVTVGEVNAAPNVTDPGDRTSDEGDVVYLAIAASDTDLPANVLTYSATGLPLGLTINEVTGEIAGTVSYTAAGSYNVDVTVTDNGTPVSLFTTVSFTWTVNDIVIPGIPLGITKVSDGGGSVLVGETIEYTIVVTNTDVEQQTNFTVSDSVPAGTTYVAASTTVDYPSSVIHTFRDEFSTQSFAGTNGSEDWSSSPWVELGEADGPLAGAWQVADDSPPAVGPYGLYKSGAKNVGIGRVVDLDPALYADASLTFKYRRNGMIPANTMLVQVSTNGLAGPWTNLFIIDGGPGGVTDAAYVDSPVIDLRDFRSTTTAIRIFHTGANDFDASRFIMFDDVEVAAIERVPASDPGGAPPTLATGYDLYPGESITVTFQVTVDTPASVSQVENSASVITDEETTPATAGPVIDAVANRNPLAVDDGPGVGFATLEDIAAYTTGNVFANDSDPDSDPISVDSFDVASTGGGTVSYNGNGTFDYSPALNFNGNDTFTYSLDDGRSGSATATVTIAVTAVNDPPSFTTGGNVTVAEDSGIYSTAWASGISEGPADESWQTVTFNITGNTNPGLFSVAPSVSSGGVLVFTPVDNANGSADVTIEAQDNGGTGNGGDDTSAPIVFTITVTGENDPPVLDPVGDKSVDELTLLSFTATSSDPADTPPNNLVFSLSGAPVGASITAGGVFSWTPTEAQDGLYTFDVVVIETDGSPSNLSDSETITVTVDEVNLAPVLDAVGDRAIAETTPLSFTATASDPDTPANLLTFSLSGAPVGASITAGGVFSWTPTEAQGPGVFSFDVVVTETNGSPGNLSDSETITVTVNEVNLAPVLDAVGDRAVDELVNLSFTATASDPDTPANLLTFSLSGAPVGASITAGGVFSWTPTEAQGPGSYAFDVVVTETNGSPSNLSDSETITVTVDEVNLAPVLDAVGDRAIAETTPLSFTATASDPDTPANLLTFSLSGAPVGASITAGGVFSWTPTEAQGPGVFSFDVVVTETNGSPGNLSDSETITVTVSEGNLAPVLDAVGDRAVDELVNLSFTATASDPDDPANALSFSLSGAPVGASITAGGVFSWTPTEAQDGLHTFDVVVTETNGSPGNLSDSETITVTVGEVNLAPVLNFVGNRAVDELVNLSFTATASDPDTPANLLTFSLSGAPVGASITAGGVFSWTPTEAQGPGVFSFDVVVTETNGSPGNLSDSESITVTVGEDNLAPTLNPVGNQTINELNTLSFTATASDPDAPVNTLLFSLAGEPVGAIIDPNTGAFSWTPTEAQGPGSYAFDVVVADDGAPGLNDSESITVTVNEVNLAPVLDAVGDRAVDELVNLSFTATASDPDTPANLLAFSLSGAPVGASITAGGVFSWTPTEAQGPGSYAFDVVVTETNGSPGNLSDSETITVTVDEVNLAPVLDAVGDRAVDELVNLSFTATASDPDDPANALSFSLLGAPVGASITAGGVFSWTPTEAQDGLHTFDVVVTETNGSPGNLSDSETITVTVGEVNLAPVLNFVGNRAVDELVNLSFTATASDPDTPANLLTFSLSGAPVGASITAGGVFSWTPTEAQGPGSYAFDVVVTETNGSPSNLSDSETITVTVDEVNLAPVLDAVGDRAIAETTPLSFTATASDPDTPANLLTFSLSGAPVGASITAGGVFSWTPTEAQGPGVFSFDVVVTETNGSPGNLSDSETITVTVSEGNLAPVLDAVGDRAVDELVNLSFTATASDPDTPANLLTFSLSGAPVGASITAGGVFSWTPTEAQGPGSYAFDVVVTETNGSPSNLSDSETITVTVDEVNLAPVLDAVGDRAIAETTPLSFTATASDPDTPANLLTFSLSGAPVGASITAGGVFSWTPTEAQGPGVFSFDVVVTETNGSPGNLSDSETITVTVSEGNLAPVLDAVGDRSVDELVNLSFTATASDPDDPANALSFSLLGAPVGASITAGGVFSWTPTEAQDGLHTFDVVVTETNGSPGNLSDSETITVTVGEVNLAPVLNFVGNRAVDELVNLSFTATASDPDTPANLLTFSLSGAPVGASITAGGVFSWTPTEAQGPGVFSFDVVVTETNGSPGNLSDSESITVTVGEDNLAPTLNPVGNQTINELNTLSFTATASDPDAPVNTLLFSLAGEPVGAIIDPNTGAFSWTPTEAQGPGSYAFDVVVADDGAPGLNDSESITVTVNEVNLAPVLDAVGDRAVDELVNLSFTATASDPDTPANLLAFSLSGAPVGASITAGGVFSWTPTEAQGPGSYAFDVVVTETNGSPGNLSDSETITVTVDEVNLAPVLDAVGDRAIAETTPLSFTATASDPDTPANLLTFSLSGAPVGASITAGGVFSWTPTEAQGPGVFSFDVVVTETNGSPGNLSDSETITVTVSEGNLAPVLDAVGDRSVDELVNLSFTATASDPDDPANALSFSLLGAPVGASITAGGVFSWTPTEAQDGLHTFDVVVTETNGSPGNLSDSETITVTVDEVNLAPVADPVVDQLIDEMTLLGLTATAGDVDQPANTLAWSLQSGPGSVLPNGDYTWAPAETDGPGTHTVVLRVTDNGVPALSDTASFTVTVDEVNVAPVADPIADVVVDELSLLAFTATGSDSDVPANTLAWSMVSGPGTVLPSGDYSWTPTEAQGPGVFTVVLRVSDNGAPSLSDTVSFDVTVGEVDLPPVLDAVGDRSVDELVNLSFTATASDPDDPANALSFSLLGAPVGASITAGGVFSWTPTEAQDGLHTFDVVVTETNGSPGNLSDSETITVTVGEVNLAPVLNFVGNRAVDELVNLSFTATASDPDTPANLLTFSLSGAPVGASITAGGVFSWTPTEAQGPGVFSFDVVVTETNGSPGNLSDSESITVTVGEDNLAPTLNPVGNQTINELNTLSFTATASDPDAPVNTLLFSLAGEPVGAIIDPNTGAFSWTPTEAQGPGSYAFDVVVADDGAPGLNDSESITVTVNEVNLAPVLDAVGDRAVDELVNLSFTATASDPDTPANLLSFSLSGAPVGASITAGGVFSWTPTEAQGPGVFSFDVVVTETNGSPGNLSDSETITVTINEINLAPAAAPIADVTMDEQTLLSLTAAATDPDLPASTLAWSIDAGPGVVLPTGEYSWFPTEADGPGVYPITLRVTDSGVPSQADSVSFTVTVDEVNSPPVVLDSAYTVDEGGILAPGPSGGVLAGAFDAEGDPVSAILDTGPAFGSLTLLADGSFTYEHDGSENFVDGFTFTAADGIDMSAPIAVTLTVNPLNDVPIIAGATLTADEGTAAGTALGGPVASDADGDPLVFSFDSPDPAFTIDSLTGTISLAGVLDFETVPSFTLNVSATDPSGASAVAPVTITVGDIDEVPTAAPAAFPVVESLPIGSTIGAMAGSDPEGEPVSFSLVGGDPAGQFTIDPTTGELILVAALDADATPSYVLSIVVTDPGGNAASTSAIVLVSPSALLPPINSSPLGLSDLVNLDEDTFAILAPLVNDTDPDGDPLFVTWIDSPINGTLTANGDGTYTYRPTPDFNGAETLRYGISDGRGGLDTAEMVLAIVAVNDPPIAPSVEATLEFVPVLEIPLPGGIYDPEGDPVRITTGAPEAGAVTLTDGVFTYIPPPEWNGVDTFSYVVTDSGGSSTSGLVTVRVSQIDGGLVALDLVTVEEVAPPPAAPSSGIAVDSIRLLVGTVAEMAGLLGIPLLAVGVAFLASILFGFSRNFLIGRGPVFLPATGPGAVGIVRTPTGAIVTALEGPGEEYPLVYRYQPAESGIRATGRQAQRGSTRWVEVETPEGDGWVIGRYVTPMVPAGTFSQDADVGATIEALRRVIADRGDVSPLVASYGLEVAYYAPSKHFAGDELAGLVAGDSSWGWWDPTGSVPSVRGEFAAIVADPLAEALATLEGRPVAEAVVEIPVELVNFPSLTFSQHDQLGWRVFFEYEDEVPLLAAIWREGVTNPASL